MRKLSALLLVLAMCVSLFGCGAAKPAETTAPATVAETSSLLEEAMQKQVFAKLDEAVKAALADVSLADLNQYIESKSASDELMYFI